jgi:hypothetical protein
LKFFSANPRYAADTRYATAEKLATHDKATIEAIPATVLMGEVAGAVTSGGGVDVGKARELAAAGCSGLGTFIIHSFVHSVHSVQFIQFIRSFIACLCQHVPDYAAIGDNLLFFFFCLAILVTHRAMILTPDLSIALD